MTYARALASFVVFSLAAACADEEPTSDTGTDAGRDAAELDMGSDVSVDGDGDGGLDSSDAAEDAGDAPMSGCTQLDIVEWTLEFEDDVSVSYEASVDGRIDENIVSFLLLFERYMPGPDIGTFDFSMAPDDNFGTCAHCAHMRSLTDPALTFYAESGTLQTRRDPYGRMLDVVGTGIRLVQVTLDAETRTSTPVPDGLCVEIADFEVSADFPADGWTCDRTLFGDGQCHCDCGAADPDCAGVFPEPPPEPVDCSEAQVCDFNPITMASFCNDRCSLDEAFSCGADGVCVVDSSGDDIDRCVTTLDAISDALIGESCAPIMGLQKWCNVVDGVAQGFCGFADTCRRLCDGPADCEGTGFDCQTFRFEEGRGFCGPIPEDG